MLKYLIPLLILSTAVGSASELTTSGADVVFRCDFESASDVNYDLWPDNWKRRRGRGFPAYVKTEITEETTEGRPTPQHCLKFQLDGGAATLYSPKIPVTALYSYVVDLHLKTESLKHSSASCSVLIFDDEGNLLEKFRSAEHRDLAEWTEVRIGPLTTAYSNSRWARIALHLLPGREADLVGTAMFDDIWMGQLPRMAVKTNNEHNVFARGDDIEVTSLISGFADPDLMMRFALRDVMGRQLATSEQAVTLDENPANPRGNGSFRNQRLSTGPRGLSGHASWQPPPLEPGYYEVHVSLPSHPELTIFRTAHLVVVDPISSSSEGEFGWSLSNRHGGLDIQSLVSLLRQVGVNWVKYPAWYDDQDEGRADELAWFAERLSTDNIQMIGVLDQPPSKTADLFDEKGPLPVASVFVESEVWRPSVDPVLTRLSLKVRWWQLGADDDTSFVNFPDLEQKLNEIRKDLNRFGQEINLGLAWRSIDEVPQTQNPPWSFLSHTADPPLTEDELHAYFAHDAEAPPLAPTRRWTLLRPLETGQYGLPARTRDLVLRMVAAKQEKLEGIFLPDPFDKETGVMHEDGSPGELLLPWRTTASLLRGAEYLGQIRLPNGSENRLFLKDNQALMVVWNDQPTTETIYLGESVQQVDVWGRRSTPDAEVQDKFRRQKIEVGRLPTFVVGANARIARWRMGFEFETKRLASVLDREQQAVYRFQNSFDQGVGGSVQLYTPIVKTTSAARLKLSPREQQREAFRVLLGTKVSSGPQEVRADFEITADRVYRFSVYRTVQVGLGDIQVELATRLDDEGNLIVEQQMINNTDQFVSFRCLLFAQGRKRMRRLVYNLGRGRTTRVFVLENGEELIDSPLWLRAEEIDGSRVLNYHVDASR